MVADSCKCINFSNLKGIHLFVQLVSAISQRNHSKYFRHIVTSKNEIQTDIQNFFEEVIDGNFAAEESSCKYCVLLQIMFRLSASFILLFSF